MASPSSTAGSNVPTADITAVVEQRSAREQQAAADEFAKAVRTHGFVGVTGHGLPQETLNQAFEMMRRFFALSREEKLKAPHPAAAIPPRGYSGPGSESVGKLAEDVDGSNAEQDQNVPVASLKDCKETFDLGAGWNSQSANIWPPEHLVPGFRSFMGDFWEQLNTISAHLLTVLMLGMHLPDEEQRFVRELHDSGRENQLRLAHYLPMTAEMRKDPKLTRLAAHCDFGSFTLLFQETRAGLEYQDRETGEFVLAPPHEGTLYLNIADMMDRMSNGFYPSSLHRVSLPTGDTFESEVPSRLSIPYFVVPNPARTLAPLASRVAADGGVAKYKSISLMEYATKKFEAVRGESSTKVKT